MAVTVVFARAIAMRVYHVFPYPWYVSGGHANAARTFIECQRGQGLDVRAISPAPAADLLRHPVPQVDISMGRGTVMQILRDHLKTSPQAPAPEAGAGLLTVPPQPCPVRYVEFDNADWEAVITEVLAESSDPAVVFHLHHLKQSRGVSEVLRRRRIPYVYTSHGELQFQDAKKYLKKFAYLNFASRIVRGASALHLLTERERDRLRVLVPFYRGLKRVIPQVVEPPVKETIQPADRAKYGIPQNAFLFLFLGRLDMIQKGLDVLIDAFVRVPKETHDGRPIHLAMVGPEFRAHLPILKEQIAKHRLADRAQFIGPQYGDEKWRVLRMADVFVSPSRWEGFAISLVEAMGMGIPSLTTVGSNIDAELRRAKAAEISPLDADCLARRMVGLMENPKLRQELSANGERWVRAVCSPAAAGALYRKCYRSLVMPGEPDEEPILAPKPGALL